MTAPQTTTATAPAARWVADAAALRPGPRTLSWLTDPGLLTERVSMRCGGDSALRVVDQRHDSMPRTDAAALGTTDPAVFVREIELVCASVVCIFAQTLVPLATLEAQPWLAELGDDALGHRLARTGDAVLESVEFALLPPGDALRDRALRNRPGTAESLWARRKHYRLGGWPLMVQEVFLPETLR